MKVEEWLPGAGEEGGLRSSCATGAEFQSEKMKKL